MSIVKLVAAPITSIEHGDAVLEVAFLMSAVDGHLADEEQAVFAELVGRVRGRAVPQQEIDELLGRFVVAVQAAGPADRVREVGPTIPVELRETAFKVAVGLALVDHEASEQEDELVGILGATLGLAERAIALAAEGREAAGAG
jgi:hypothetical protein